MHSFDPVTAFGGGLLIGLAAAVLLLLNGRIAGISGILGGFLDGERSNLAWRLAFLVGLIGGGGLLLHLRGTAVQIDAPWPVLEVAGLLVGFGTRLGSGCTSGHGVCGLARGSRRSLTSTVIFMAVAAITVFVVRHLMGG